jgi:hypothetical protein
MKRREEESEGEGASSRQSMDEHHREHQWNSQKMLFGAERPAAGADYSSTVEQGGRKSGP